MLWVKWELWLGHAILHSSCLVGAKLLILEVLSTKRSTKVGLSIVAVATTTIGVSPAAVETAIGAVPPAILSLVAKGLLWSIVITPVVIAVPEAAKVSPAAGVAVPIRPTSAAPASTCGTKTAFRQQGLEPPTHRSQ